MIIMIQHKAKKWGVEQVAEERDLLEEFLVIIERMAKDDITVIHNVKRVCNAWRRELDSIKDVSINKKCGCKHPTFTRDVDENFNPMCSKCGKIIQ